MKNLKRDPMKTKTGKPRLGPLNVEQLDNLLEMCRPKNRAKILRRIKQISRDGNVGTEQLYFIIGFLLGTLITGCLLGMGFIIWYDWYHQVPDDKVG